MRAARWARSRFGAREAEAGLEERLCWILGSGRSGSTWLLRLLIHPLAPSFTDRTGVELPAGAGPLSGRVAMPLDEPHVGSHLAPQWTPPALRDETEGDPERFTFNGQAGAGSGTNYLLAPEWRPVWEPDLRRAVLRRIGAQVTLAERSLGVRRPVVAIKDPNASHASHLTLSLLPRSRLLFLARDGRDVVDSHVHAYAPGGWMSDQGGAAFRDPGERLAFARRMALLWARRTNSTLHALEAHDPSLARMIRYEDLLADPGARLSELVSWLELDHDDRWVAEAVGANSFAAVPEAERGARKIQRFATPGAWRENLTAEERAAIGEILAPWLERLGYPD